MKLKNIIKTAAFGCLLVASASCSDYLDVSKEMSENLTESKVWESPVYTRNWYGNIYLCMSEYSETGSEANAFKNPWSNLCGEIASQNMPGRDAMVSGYTASSAQFHRWATLYQYIRQAMIFIRDAKDEGVGSDQNEITPEEMARMKDEARYLEAYSYFSLFELYGPFCIVRQIDDAAYPKINNYERASVDECVNYIDSLLADVLSRNNLPETVITNKGETPASDAFNLREVVRPTKIAARALRAKLWVYAASPLFNGGWDKAMELKNPDGKQLFPAKDPNKWVIAKQHLEELLQACEEDGHGLYEYQINGTNNPEMSLYRLFQDYNREILWCSTNNDYSNQYNVFNMYSNREPRFYQDVNYQGKSWYKAYQSKSGNNNYQIDFSLNGGAGPASTNTPKTGYLLGKFYNRTVNHVSGDVNAYTRVSIIYRLADFYLYYAEVLNENSEVDVPLNYADYYYLEALIRRSKSSN